MASRIKKAESEKAIRSLCHDWYRKHRTTMLDASRPSFYDFKMWLYAEGYSYLLDFQSVAGADEDAERWFDQELKQTWRN